MADANSQTPGQQPEENRPPLGSFIPGQQQPAQAQPSPQAAYGPVSQAPKKPKSKKPLLIIIAAVIIVIAVAAALIAITPHKHAVTTTSTTTVYVIKTASVTNCTTIKSPGRYYITRNITTKMQSGACINITSSNVELIGNGNFVTGSGPYVDIPPFTYGVFANDVRNVTIDDVGVESFSYGIYLSNVSYSNVSYSNATKDVLSGIYLMKSSHNTVSWDSVSHTSGAIGAVDAQGGGDNLFLNDTIYSNAYYGLVVNSTGNAFAGDHLLDNPVDLMCNMTSGYTHANRFINSTCSVNDYCSFAQCSVANTPPNLRSIVLQRNISSCGSINTPGTYALSSSINVANYLNLSNPLSKGMPCISLNTVNVNLNCNGKNISNAAYGLLVKGLNDTASDCALVNDTYGIMLNNTISSSIKNVSAENSVYGIYLKNASSGIISHYSASGNDYAVYVNGSSGVSISNVTASNNTYGVFFAGGGNDVFLSSKMMQSKKADFYCTASSYNSTVNIAQGVSCGLTDCDWVSCAEHALPPISVYPISNCGTISQSGNYSINNNILALGSCFRVTTSNVKIACNNHTVSGNSNGEAFVLNNVKNVSITGGCNISNFATAFGVENSSYININRIRMAGVGSGVEFSNVSYSNLSLVALHAYSSPSGIELDKVANSIVTNNTVYNGVNSTSYGFLLSGSTNNLLAFNNVTLSKYGIGFVNSTGNDVFNNTAYGNSAYSYYCAGNSTGLYSNKNVVNFGNTKYNCIWLVESNPLIAPQCYAISSSSHVTFQSDMLYNYGSTCYNIYNTNSGSANNTVINCNNHTILATHGGVFARIENSSNVKIENCYLKNFTNPIISGGAYSTVINNTIANANTSILLGNARYPKVSRNTILNSSTGIIAESSNYGGIYNNSMHNTSIGIEIVGGMAFQVYNNSDSHGSIGMYLINTTLGSFGNNRLTSMGRYGIACTGYATNSSSLNNDYGGNICSSNSNCKWMTTSTSCLV